MKKLLTITIIILISSMWSVSHAQVRGGFKMGVDFSNFKWDVGNQSVNDEFDTKRLITPRIGFILEVGIVENLFIQTGVFGAAKGFRFKDTRTISNVDYDSKEYQFLATIDVPVNVGYKFDLGDVKLFGMLGPSLSYGIYTTLLYKANGEYDNDHQSVGNSVDDEFKPLNFGINFEGGVEVDRFQFTAFYTQGLSDLSNVPDMMTIKTNVFGLTAAMKFGKVD